MGGASQEVETTDMYYISGLIDTYMDTYIPTQDSCVENVGLGCGGCVTVKNKWELLTGGDGVCIMMYS